MAVKVLNRSKAICDVSTYEGGSVVLNPGHALVLPDDVSEQVINYYKAFEKIGLRVIIDKPVVANPVEKKAEEPVSKENSESDNSEQIETEISEKDLSRMTKAQLINIANEKGITDLEGLTKAQVIERIVNAG